MDVSRYQYGSRLIPLARVAATQCVIPNGRATDGMVPP